MNMYAYAGNDPVNGRDPSGNFRLTNAYTVCSGNCSGLGYFNSNPGSRNSGIDSLANANATRHTTPRDPRVFGYLAAYIANRNSSNLTNASYETSTPDKINNRTPTANAAHGLGKMIKWTIEKLGFKTANILLNRASELNQRGFPVLAVSVGATGAALGGGTVSVGYLSTLPLEITVQRSPKDIAREPMPHSE